MSYSVMMGCSQPMIFAGDPAATSSTKLALPTREDLTDFHKPWPYIGIGLAVAMLGGAFYLDFHKKGRK